MCPSAAALAAGIRLILRAARLRPPVPATLYLPGGYRRICVFPKLLEGAISEAERKIKDAKAHIARLKAARAFFEERLKDGDVFAGKRASKITRKKPAEPTFASTL